MMFDELIRRYDLLVTTSAGRPQDRDMTQAYGMSFFDEWSARKSDICSFLSYPEDDFDYNKYRTLVPMIKKALENAK